MAAGSYACDAAEGTPDGVGVTTLASGQCACPAGMYTGSVGQTSCTAECSHRDPVAQAPSTREHRHDGVRGGAERRLCVPQW